MSLVFLIGVPALLLALWILAQDPTIQTYRRRMRLSREMRGPSNEKLPEEPVAVQPSGSPGILPKKSR